MRRQLAWMLLGLAALVTGTAAGDEPRSRKNVSYVRDGSARNKLDIYAPAEGQNHPIVVWVHGGAWKIGDKGAVQSKPAALNEKGYVLVSINYRLHPAASYRDQAGDVAQAIRWVRDHALEFGGDPGRIAVMGHSAGAHLAALVGADGRYLERVGMKPGDLKGVVLLDGAGYDIPKQIEQAALPRLKTIYTEVFSQDRATQLDASPITHVRRGKVIPPYLILHVASRRDSKRQSEGLAAKLKEAGASARVVPAAGKSHATINREFGEPGDVPTREVLAFLKERFEPEKAPR